MPRPPTSRKPPAPTPADPAPGGAARPAARGEAIDGPGVATRPGRGGRPTAAQARELTARIVQVATRRFLDQGYEATRIEAVALDAGISKRTFYARFADKAALFGAVVHDIIGRVSPAAGIPPLAGRSLEEALTGLAGLILDAALARDSLALYRMIVAESVRFPELSAVVAGQGAVGRAVEVIAQVLLAHRAGQGLGPPAAREAAEHFLFMVLALPQRRALGLGPAMTTEELQRWKHTAVGIFLGGFLQQPER